MMTMHMVLLLFLLASNAVAFTLPITNDRKVSLISGRSFKLKAQKQYGVTVQCDFRRLALKKLSTSESEIKISNKFKEDRRVYSIEPKIAAAEGITLSLALQADFTAITSESTVTGTTKKGKWVFVKNTHQIVCVVKKDFSLGSATASITTTDAIMSVDKNDEGYSLEKLDEMAKKHMKKIYGTHSLTVTFNDKLPKPLHYGFVPNEKCVRIKVQDKDWIKIDRKGNNAPDEDDFSTFVAKNNGCLYLQDEGHAFNGYKLNYYYHPNRSLYVSTDYTSIDPRPRWKYDAKNKILKISYLNRELTSSHHMKEKGRGGEVLVEKQNNAGKWVEL